MTLVLDQCRVTGDSILLVELRSQQMGRLHGGMSAQFCDGQGLRFERRVEVLQLRGELRVVRFKLVIGVVRVRWLDLPLLLLLLLLLLLRRGQELRR